MRGEERLGDRTGGSATGVASERSERSVGAIAPAIETINLYYLGRLLLWTMWIHVTEMHIMIGAKGNERYCSIALAAKEATGRDWLVGPTHMLDEGDGKEVHLPWEAQVFAVDFDRGMRVEPMSFQVEL